MGRAAALSRVVAGGLGIDAHTRGYVEKWLCAGAHARANRCALGSARVIRRNYYSLAECRLVTFAYA